MITNECVQWINKITHLTTLLYCLATAVHSKLCLLPLYVYFIALSMHVSILCLVLSLLFYYLAITR